jgi:hypothetical protein
MQEPWMKTLRIVSSMVVMAGAGLLANDALAGGQVTNGMIFMRPGQHGAFPGVVQPGVVQPGVFVGRPVSPVAASGAAAQPPVSTADQGMSRGVSGRSGRGL